MRTTINYRLMPIAAFALAGLLSTTSAQQVAAQECGVGDPGLFYIGLPIPPDLPNYVAISNNSLLSYVWDSDGGYGIITQGSQDTVFRVARAGYSGINDKRTTVGSYNTDNGIVGWIRTFDGRVRTLSLPDAHVLLTSINNNNVAVGYLQKKSSPYGIRPIIVDDAGVRVVELPGIPANTDAVFNDINDSGAIVGSYRIGFRIKAFHWLNNVVTPIELGGAMDVEAVTINNRGQIGGNFIAWERDLPKVQGFVRDPNGKLRTVNLELPFPETFHYFGTWRMYYQESRIRNLNDRGQVLFAVTAYYIEEDGGGGEIGVCTKHLISSIQH